MATMTAAAEAARDGGPMTPHRIEPTAASVAGFFLRSFDVSGAGWLTAALAGAWNLLGSNPFPGIYLLVVLASAVDYYWGRRIAHQRRRFMQERAIRGQNAKMIGLCLLFMVWLFEMWATRYALAGVFGIDTHGIGATVLCALRFWAELDSIDEKMRAEGGAGLLGLPIVSAFVRGRAVDRLPTPAAPAGPDQEVKP